MSSCAFCVHDHSRRFCVFARRFLRLHDFIRTNPCVLRNSSSNRVSAYTQFCQQARESAVTHTRIHMSTIVNSRLRALFFLHEFCTDFPSSLVASLITNIFMNLLNNSLEVLMATLILHANVLPRIARLTEWHFPEKVPPCLSKKPTYL